MKRILCSQLFVLGLVLFLHTDAMACSCILIGGESLKQQVTIAKKDSKAVFSARVLAITKEPENYFVSVRLLVEDVWKGKLTKEVFLTTGSGGGGCGYPFEVGENYLIYAYASNIGSLSTGICSRTKTLSDSAQDVKVLGKGKPVPYSSTQSYPQYKQAKLEAEGNLSGLVLDSNGARVARAKVVIESKKFTIETRSDAEGYYKTSLTKGKYTIRVPEGDGWHASGHKSIVIVPNSSVRHDFVLRGITVDAEHP